MSASFAVPCAVCSYGPKDPRHDESKAHLWQPLAHYYTPNESSVEFAALKMREALQIAMLDSREFLPLGSYRMHSIGDAALALADAAGIKAETTT